MNGHVMATGSGEPHNSISLMHAIKTLYTPRSGMLQKQIDNGHYYPSDPSCPSPNRSTTTYLGDMSNPTNWYESLQEQDNTSLFIKNLAGDCEEHDLLASVHGSGCGRVFSTEIRPPRPQEGHHGCAAYIRFADPESASRFMEHVRADRFIVKGRNMRGSVLYDRKGKRAPRMPLWATRVVELTGLTQTVDEARLRPLFRNISIHETEAVRISWVSPDGLVTCLEWAFCSYQAQAQAAVTTLSVECPGLEIRYLPDPCSLVTFTEYVTDGA
ncbi:hypothetical protein BJ170DRAFT_685329 [Xylariales sp. AK1849]|nr:hypothetical protein BJ170DRAFT_685329 [Xylariales sp. AK1849]